MVLELSHSARLRSVVMVHAQQVQNPVDEQVAELGRQRSSPRLGLRLRGLDGDQHVAEAILPELGPHSFLRRERQNVSGPMRATEASSYLRNPHVTGEGDGKLGVREAQGV